MLNDKHLASQQDQWLIATVCTYVHCNCHICIRLPWTMCHMYKTSDMNIAYTTILPPITTFAYFYYLSFTCRTVLLCDQLMWPAHVSHLSLLVCNQELQHPVHRITNLLIEKLKHVIYAQSFNPAIRMASVSLYGVSEQIRLYIMGSLMLTDLLTEII